MRGSLVTGLLIGQFAIGSICAEEGTVIPDGPLGFLAEYCIDCHDASAMKGDLNLDLASIDWSRQESRELWEKVLKANEEGLMPPPKKDQPSKEERGKLIDWLDSSLMEHTPIGGTLPRRLNQAEYQATIRSLLFLPDFKLPLGFPRDMEYHGFDNIGEGLVVSPSHLEAYAKVAHSLADEVYPPAKAKPEKQKWEAGPEDMVLSFSAASVVGDALRLASRAVDIMRSCSWPSRIEISDSGTYRISVDASKFLSNKGPSFEEAMILEVYARALTATERSKVQDFRLLTEIKVTSEEPQKSSFKADLYEGETVLFRWKNAEMTHDPPAVGEAFEKLAREYPRFLAAWLKVIFPTGNPKKPTKVSILRGRNGWDSVSKYMEDPDLDLTHASADSALTQAFFKIAQKGKTSIADCLCYFYHTNGPAMEIHHLTIEGPLKLVESPADLKRRELQLRITGTPHEGQSQEEFVHGMLSGFLPRAFRKPVSNTTIERYLTIATRHWDEGHTYEEGMHLLLRNILISPRFLYRSLEPDGMDDFDLATRLSYFLTQAPPDETLIDLAQRGRLSAVRSSKADPSKMEYWVLCREAKRLMPTDRTDPMIQSFVGQWLDSNSLHGIMPDPIFDFDKTSIDIAKHETEQFFTEILTQNLPMTDFIDPDFTYTSPQFAKVVYGLDPDDQPGPGSQKTNDRVEREPKRFELKRGGRVGGLLGQSAIMMATANGVDTQPVLRGVWVLENILGTPPPEPPKDVPALTPDTRGTTTPRELLAAHTKEAKCVVCHKRIDPFGLALENFDPVGRWRSNWPKANKAIDASVVLADGTRIQDVVDLKRWLVANIDQFSQCLAEKLMIYATGRVPNYAERKELADIVRANRETGNGFRDLVLTVIESRTFRTR